MDSYFFACIPYQRNSMCLRTKLDLMVYLPNDDTNELYVHGIHIAAWRLSKLNIITCTVV